MSGFSDTFSVLASGMRSQSSRLRFVSENIANADTPGYRRKTAAFEQAMAGAEVPGAVHLGPVRLDQTALPQVFDPSHPMADDQGYYAGSNVNLVIELADAREAQRSYEANVKMFEQTRQMSGALMDILKR